MSRGQRHPNHARDCRCRECYGDNLSSFGSDVNPNNAQQGAQFDDVPQRPPPTQAQIARGHQELQDLLNMPQLPRGGSIWENDSSVFRAAVRQGTSPSPYTPSSFTAQTPSSTPYQTPYQQPPDTPVYCNNTSTTQGRTVYYAAPTQNPSFNQRGGQAATPQISASGPGQYLQPANPPVESDRSTDRTNQASAFGRNPPRQQTPAELRRGHRPSRRGRSTQDSYSAQDTPASEDDS